MKKRTWAEIDLSVFKNNIKAVRKITGDGVHILLPVKADAYGHGILEIARLVESDNLARMLGVASIDEGILLRQAGITIPILILSLFLPDEDMSEYALKYDLRATVADLRSAESLSKAASRLKKTAIVHIKIDTGMGRIGCFPGEAAEIAKKTVELPGLKLEGAYSHLPSADEPDQRKFTENQINLFKNTLENIERSGIKIPLKHIANSAGTTNFPESHMDMVRPGIFSYGFAPHSADSHRILPVPPMSFKSMIIFIKRVEKNTPLSYGLTYSTPSACNIATIAAGYGDGYSRLLSNKGKILIEGKLYPVAGRVSMDQTLVNLGDDIYPVGTEATLFGHEKFTAEDLADIIGTIPYEIICAVSKRVPRIYLN